ncbi:MAG: flagellar biosynthetic protein FliR [Halieaceae bacterium]|jgi:flagellar biosynthetic protein FliR
MIDQLAMYYWPFLRFSALLLASPVFSSATINVRVRVFLSVLISALVAPLLPAQDYPDPLSGVGVLMAAREVLIGLAMGFVMQLVFGAVVVAGQSVAMSMGLGFAMSIDPQNGVQVPVVSQFNMVLATLLFLGLDGHLFLLKAGADSYNLLPAGGAQPLVDMFGAVVNLGGQLFASALLLALPTLTAILMINVSFGVITRAAPQLNIFAVGFPVTILAGFFFMFLALPAYLAHLQRFMSSGLQQMLQVLS